LDLIVGLARGVTKHDWNGVISLDIGSRVTARRFAVSRLSQFQRNNNSTTMNNEGLPRTGFRDGPDSQAWTEAEAEDVAAPNAFPVERAIYQMLQNHRNAAGGNGSCPNHGGCKGAMMLVSSRLNPWTQGDVVPPAQPPPAQLANQTNVPFYVIQPFLTEMVQFGKSLATAAGGPLSPEVLAAFVRAFVPYWGLAGNNNTGLFRLRDHNDAPYFCSDCVELVLGGTNFGASVASAAAVAAVQAHNTVQAHNPNNANFMHVLWQLFREEFLARVMDPGIVVPEASAFAASIVKGGWVYSEMFAIQVAAIFETRLCRPDKKPVVAWVVEALARHSALQTHASTVSGYCSDLNTLSRTVPYVIAETQMIGGRDAGGNDSLEENVVFDVERNVAFSVNGQALRYGSGVAVHRIPAIQRRAIRTVAAGATQTMPFANSIGDLFGVVLGTQGRAFETQIGNVAREYFKWTLNLDEGQDIEDDEDEEAKQTRQGQYFAENYQVTWQVSFAKRELDATAEGYSYTPLELLDPLEATLALEEHGHKAATAVMPVGKGVWTRVCFEPPIDCQPVQPANDSPSSRGSGDPGRQLLQAVLTNEDRGTNWAHDMPFRGTQAISRLYRGYELGDAAERYRTSQDPPEPLPAGTPVATQREAAANLKRKRAKNERNARNRITRSQDSLKLRDAFQADGGARDSAFVYVNGDNICIFPAIMFTDSNLRTDPYGSRHLKFRLYLENKNADRSVKEILNDFGDDEGLRRFYQQPIRVPMKESQHHNAGSYDNRLAAAQLLDARVTDALAKFAATFFM
jgi:hypothetical protein